jgi:hypothetical protein
MPNSAGQTAGLKQETVLAVLCLSDLLFDHLDSSRTAIKSVILCFYSPKPNVPSYKVSITAINITASPIRDKRAFQMTGSGTGLIPEADPCIHIFVSLSKSM